MTADRTPALAELLNAALGTALADFDEASEFLNSEEGWAALEEWLAANRGADDEKADTETEGIAP